MMPGAIALCDKCRAHCEGALGAMG